jgi:head-tail adaptor
MRHRVRVILRTQTANDDGGINYGDLLINTIWADIQPVKGSVYLLNQQIDQQITHKIYIRYFPSLTTEHWLTYDQSRFVTNVATANLGLIQRKMFRIKGVENVLQLQRFMALNCEEYFQS